MMEIPVANIRPNPEQPRTRFDGDAIDELAASIQEHGLLQPILVEDNQDGTYTLVSGERRWRAFQELGRTEIPAIIRERSNHGGRELLVHALIENIRREDMNAIDEARAYQRMHDEFGMSYNEVARHTGSNPPLIHQRVVLLKLEQEIQDLISAGKFQATGDVARALLQIPDASARVRLVGKAAEHNMPTRTVIATAKKLAEALGGAKLDMRRAKSPAMAVVQGKTWDMIDEQTQPSGWDALKQVGRVPAWKTITDAVTNTCKNCTLSHVASKATCEACPMSEFLSTVVRAK